MASPLQCFKVNTENGIIEPGGYLYIDISRLYCLLAWFIVNISSSDSSLYNTYMTSYYVWNISFFEYTKMMKTIHRIHKCDFKPFFNINNNAGVWVIVSYYQLFNFQCAELLFFVIDNQTRSTASMVEAAFHAGYVS